MLSVVILSGCELIPQDVVEQSLEQLCLEDPSNELCTIDSLDDIEESVVLGLVNSVLANLDEADFEEYCVQYLSETAADLVDDCIAQSSTFLPENLGTATAVEVSKNGSVYTLTVQTDTPYEYFMLEVTVGSVDGATKILTWSAGAVYLDQEELTNDVQLELINSFFMALGDSTESDSVICGEYYDGIDNDCDDIEDFDRSGDYVVVSVTPLGDNTYEVVYTVDGNQMTTKLHLDSDDDGDSIIVEIEHEESETVDPDGFVISAEAEQFIRDFVRDYQDSDYSFDELNEMYFMNMLEPDFFDGRVESLELGFTMTIVELLPGDEDWYEVSLEVLVDGMTETSDVKIRVNRIDMALYLELGDGEDNDCDGVCEPDEEFVTGLEAENFILEFVASYQSLDYTDEELNQMYFMNKMDPGFFEARIEQLENGFMITVIDLTLSEDGWYDVSLEFTFEGETVINTTRFKVNRIDMALYLEMDDGEDNDCDGICVVGDEAEQFIVAFLTDFDDPTVSDEEIVTTYFMGVYDANVMDGRMDLLETGYSIDVLDIYPVENGFYVVEVEVAFDSEVMTTSIRIRVNRIDMALYLEIDEDYEEECMSCLTYDEAQLFINTFYADYTNVELSLEDFNNLYMNGTISPTIMENRDMYTDGTYELFFVYMYSLSENTYEFQMDVYVDGEIVDYLYYTVMLYFDNEGMIVFDIYETPSYEPLSTEEMVALYQTYLNDYYNSNLTNQELADLYFYGYTPLWLAFNRSDELLSGEVVELLNLTNLDGYGYFEIELRKTVGEEVTEYTTYAAGFSYGDELNLSINDPILDYLYSSFYYFDEMIQDETYTVEDVCSTLDSASADLCAAVVEFHRTNSYSIQLDNFEYDEVNGLILFVNTYDSNWDFVETNEFRLIYSSIENPLYIQSTENTTNPLYE